MGLAIVSVLVLLAAAVGLLTRANELFFVSVRGGDVLLVRGRLPPPLLDEIGDVIGRAGVARGSVRAVVERGAPRIVARGLEEGVAQRLRNVLGLYSLRQIRHAPRAPRNLGQALGITWLAWLLAEPLRR
jgi:hypothetical protein